MKKLILVALILGFNVAVKAQSGDTKSLLAAVEKFRLALISGDKDQLENIASPTLSYGHSGGKIEDKAAFVETFVSGKSDFITAEFANQTTAITGNTALVRHVLSGKTNDGGKPGELHLGILLVWQKQGSDWKLIGRQAYKLPVATPP